MRGRGGTAGGSRTRRLRLGLDELEAEFSCQPSLAEPQVARTPLSRVVPAHSSTVNKNELVPVPHKLSPALPSVGIHDLEVRLSIQPLLSRAGRRQDSELRLVSGEGRRVLALGALAGAAVVAGRGGRGEGKRRRRGAEGRVLGWLGNEHEEREREREREKRGREEERKREKEQVLLLNQEQVPFLSPFRLQLHQLEEDLPPVSRRKIRTPSSFVGRGSSRFSTQRKTHPTYPPT